MSIATINQGFRVIDGSVDAISTLNGNISMDTAPTGQIELKQNTVPVVNISPEGQVSVTAKDTQNIYLTTTNGGKTIISNLDYTLDNGIHTETISVEHDIPNVELSVITPDSGSYMLLIDGVVDDTGTSSDCSACIFMVKKKLNNGITNVLCSVAGDQGEALAVSWIGTTISLQLSGGTLESYEKTISTFNVKLIGA